MSYTRRPMSDLSPDPELWAALQHGELLRRILGDFYGRAFEDPRLGPFFEGLTKDWVAQKQYNFMRAKLTGDKSFFGNRPRKAHHWMVISHELFDHREAVMEACLRDAGLPERLIDRWLGIDEVFRKQIVKDAPVPLEINGVALPLEGWEQATTEIGVLCDGCGEPVDAGAAVLFHVRTGRMTCAACSSATAGDASSSSAIERADESARP